MLFSVFRFPFSAFLFVLWFLFFAVRDSFFIRLFIVSKEKEETYSHAIHSVIRRLFTLVLFVTHRTQALYSPLSGNPLTTDEGGYVCS